MNVYIFIAVWVFMGFIILRVYAKRKNTIKSAVFGMLSGGLAITAVHFFGSYINIDIPLNLFNTAISLILGIPGAAVITAVNYFL